MAMAPRHWPALTSAAALALLIPVSARHSPSSVSPVRPVAAARSQAATHYGDLPLAFEANQGQTDGRVKFLARGAGFSLFLTSGEAVLTLRRVNQQSDVARAAHSPDRVADAAGLTASTIVRLALAGGANPAPEVEGLYPRAGKSHYLLGNDPAHWHRDVAHFGKVRYRQVYPGVDLVYYGNQRKLEYDFIVAPGADPGRIRLEASGVQALRLDKRGNLVLGTGHGDLVQLKPRVYQDIGGRRRPIDARYALLDGQRIGFAIGRYDTLQPLVIDPVLTYSSYLGGGGWEDGEDIAVDAAGNAYVTGFTDSADFPTAKGRQATAGGSGDVFVAKFNAAGTALAYSTYIGGSGRDMGLGIAVDARGNAYVTGYTESPNFPTAAALQPASAGGPAGAYRDVFVSKLNASGSALVYSTYLGGADEDFGIAIAVDATGHACVTGETRSSNFPTLSPRQGAHGGGVDVFISKFNTAGSALVYSTYLGGSGLDSGQAIAVDGTGNAYVAGYTTSSNFPTSTPLQATNAGAIDGFVAKLNAAGNAWLYRTYLGGNHGDAVFAIAVDATGAAYLAGQTASSNFPTAAALQPAHAGGINDAFVSKLDAAGRALTYSTYLGGNGDFESGNGIAVDRVGNAYVTGTTDSTNFPTAARTLGNQPADDAFVTQLNAAGSALIYSTYLGGASVDSGRGIALDAAGNSYVVGDTESVDFPTVHPVQAANAGSSDGWVTKIATAIARSVRVDFNGDARSDILWRNHVTGTNMIWKSAGSATPQAVAALSSQAWQVAAVGDFNDDGKADILWRNHITGGNVIWKSARATTLQAVAGLTNQAWQVAGVGDFNGDRKADILWRNGSTGADMIWKSGSSSSQQATAGVPNLDWRIVGVDDFNGDGNADILWRNASTGANVIWKSGRATTQQSVATVTSLPWQVVGTGDFNGDGKADILWHNASTGANMIWKSALKATQQAITGVANLDWRVVATGDYNGDGATDILWRNMATGANVIWKSARSTSAQTVTGISNLAWMVAPP